MRITNETPGRKRGPRISKPTNNVKSQSAATLREQPSSTGPKPLVSTTRAQQPSSPSFGLTRFCSDPGYPWFLLQPCSDPELHESIASKVKSIYDELKIVETKCIHVDRTQAAAYKDPQGRIDSEHWQELIVIHRTLLEHHCDFFMASHHSSASPSLRRLASEYTMPARMWKYSIHAFLELLRQNLPGSLEYIVAFIHLAYEMIALLYETVPTYEDTWIECLGHLSRYRMAIEEGDMMVRQTWTNIAWSWYSKSADKNPQVGRLYHHLAILAQRDVLEQIYYYSRSMNSVEPFPSARESVMTLFKKNDQQSSGYTPGSHIQGLFLLLHARQCKGLYEHWYDQVRLKITDTLDNHIGVVASKWKEQGVYIAVTNISAWFDYGDNLNPLRQLFCLRAELRENPNYLVEPLAPEAPSEEEDLKRPRFTMEALLPMLKANEKDSKFCRAAKLTNEMFALVLRRNGDKNVLPHVYVMLSFIATFAAIDPVSHLIDQVPWADVVGFLNSLIITESIVESLTQPVFAAEGEKGAEDSLPLPEDWLIRGLIWAEEHLPTKWFSKAVDKKNRYLELPSTTRRRSIRVLRLGYKLSLYGCWILYDKCSRTFEIV